MGTFYWYMWLGAVLASLHLGAAELVITFPEDGEGTISIPEDTPVGSVIATLNSTGGTVYLQLDPPDPLHIQLDFDGTVLVATSANLDYEVNRSHVLNFRATGGGELATGTLHVNLTDVNDNNPVFPQQTYPFLVVHGSGGGTYVGVVNASDADGDEEQNTIVSYEFVGAGNTSETFSVNETGHIEIAEGMTVLGNVRPGYLGILVATDSGNPALQGSTSVVVAICGGYSSDGNTVRVNSLLKVVVVAGILAVTAVLTQN